MFTMNLKTRFNVEIYFLGYNGRYDILRNWIFCADLFVCQKMMEILASLNCGIKLNLFSCVHPRAVPALSTRSKDFQGYMREPRTEAMLTMAFVKPILWQIEIQFYRAFWSSIKKCWWTKLKSQDIVEDFKMQNRNELRRNPMRFVCVMQIFV